MIKWLGALVIVISSTYIGFNAAKALDKRLKLINSIIKMLKEIEIMLSYCVMTKDEILSKVFQNEEYKPFAYEKINALEISKKEKSALESFYKQLGKTDLQGQLSAIKMYIQSFEESYKDLKAEKDNKCRLYRTAGILVGVFISLMLV